MSNDLSKALKKKTDAQLRLLETDSAPVVRQTATGDVYTVSPTDYMQTLAAGTNITITTAGNVKTISAAMNLLGGAGITISEPDANGQVTVSGTVSDTTILGKTVEVADFTGKDGYALTYDETSGKFVLSEQSGALPQATETILGGVRAKAKTTETAEVAIDASTGKLFAPAPDEAANGIPAGGTAGQILSKVDGTDYNAQWVNASGGGGGLSKSHVGAYFMTPPTNGLTAREIIAQRFVPLANITATSVKVAIFNMTGRLRLMIYKTSAWEGNFTKGDLVYSGSYENLSASPPCVHTFPAMSVALTEGQIFAFVIESETGATLQGSSDPDLSILGHGSLLPSSSRGGYGTRAGSTITQYTSSIITMQIEYSA